jgi:hypothetical protein
MCTGGASVISICQNAGVRLHSKRTHYDGTMQVRFNKNMCPQVRRKCFRKHKFCRMWYDTEAITQMNDLFSRSIFLVRRAAPPSARDSGCCQPGPDFGFGARSAGPILSRHCARVFIEKIIAAMFPAFAAANKYPQFFALASATPRSSSSRKRLRSVFGEQPMILAMSSWRTPTPAKYRALSRIASFTANACLAMCRS